MHFAHFVLLVQSSIAFANGSETLILKVKRIQKYVETLDVLNVKNYMLVAMETMP